MITKFKTDYSNTGIERVEVLRETDKCVFLPASGSWKNGERRELKRTDYGNYYDTWLEAHEYLMVVAHSSVSRAETKFQIEMDKRKAIEGLKDE